MTIPSPAPAPAPNLDPAPVYEAPRIVHKGQLKQFSGSPLAVDPGADVLGLPK